MRQRMELGMELGTETRMDPGMDPGRDPGMETRMDQGWIRGGDGHTTHSHGDGHVGCGERAHFGHLLRLLQRQLLVGGFFLLLLVLQSPALCPAQPRGHGRWAGGGGWPPSIASPALTLVSSCALARLSTAMAKKTLRRVSGRPVKAKHLPEHPPPPNSPGLGRDPPRGPPDTPRIQLPKRVRTMK